MLLFTLDPNSATPCYLQIRDAIVSRVDDGTLSPGDVLPPTRVFAESLGVHRSTVLRAYDEIRALGYLESRPGSYTTVRRRARPPSTSTTARGPGESKTIHWDRLAPGPFTEPDSPSRSTEISDVGEPPIDLERLAADPSLAPVDDLRRCLNGLMTEAGAEMLDYAHPAGWPPLREIVAARLRAHGVAVGVDGILVTNGAQQAIDLTLRLLCRPGDRVVVEAPTYGMLHPLLRLHGVRPLEIPMNPDGMDLDRLERALEENAPQLVYTMPNFHNPMGVTTSQPHRERLLELCESRRVPILEDGFEEEMKYFGRAVLPVKSMDRAGSVIYVGTFSKVVFPGFRVGWIAAHPAAIARMTEIQHVSNLATNTIAQAASARFYRRGGFETYLRRIHRVYRRRMQALLDGLAAHLPPTAEWTRPQGGYTAWLSPTAATADEPMIVDRLLSAGVRVAPGRRFFAAPPEGPHLRLSVACIDESAIAEGCRRIGRVLGDLE